MTLFNPEANPHRRYNPLKDEWVLVSPQRMQRPWKGKIEMINLLDNNSENNLNDEQKNPLGPMGIRPNGEINPDYTDTFVFNNDFPALVNYGFNFENKEKLIIKECGEANLLQSIKSNLLRSQVATGLCQVMCFHPKSNVTLSTISEKNIISVIKEWIRISVNLQLKYEWIQIFENKGSIMGCSNPHPHCQIWASSFLPTEINKKNEMQRKYFEENKRVLLLDYIALEQEEKVRLVIESSHWLCLVPYWAVWPYETYLIPKRHILRLQDLNEKEQEDLAFIMKKLLIKYDNLFKTSLPYSMGWHGAPTGSYLDKDCNHWQLHALYFPPLLRSATVKKFLVGYEMLAESQRDLTAEQAAKTLRELPESHYTDA